MKVLGLSAGNAGGSAEILLKEALRAAQDVGATPELVRIRDLELATGPGVDRDDAPWFWDRLMESDGIIVASPIYSRTVPGILRLLGDKISGPQADVAFTAELLRMRAEGAEIAVDFPIDERVLKPRVAGFLAVGGSLPSYWKTLALPLMHTLTASAQIAVVDQAEFAGAGSPSSIVLDPDALARAARLGRNVGEQLGRPFDDAEYRGEPGLCPVCHLSVFAFRDGAALECAACGAGGTLRTVDGAFRVDFSAEGLAQSVIALAEKRAHFQEVQETAARQAPHRDEIERRTAEYLAWDPRVTPERG
ncbi:MAG TPA: NAD(P)H-dependent oxidoreductase [Amnibacterium sp.]|nr:NAD(P)H-dependent oxidoreductase [Amnibacterium sp.]